MLNHVKGLKFEEKPDYHYLKSLINNIREEVKLSIKHPKLSLDYKKTNTLILKDSSKSIVSSIDRAEVVTHQRSRAKSKSMVPLKKNIHDNTLQIPVNEFHKTISTGFGSGPISKSSSNTEETQKVLISGFSDRKKLFRRYQKFRKRMM